jgi:hypothetical protein
MCPERCVDLIRLGAASPQASAKIYDFGVRRTDGDRLRRVRALEHENALLARALSETRAAVVRLRTLLAAP